MVLFSLSVARLIAILRRIGEYHTKLLGYTPQPIKWRENTISAEYW
jgi:hypothetical protein